jgi:hypothetical protein
VVNLVVGTFAAILNKIADYQRLDSGWFGSPINIYHKADIRSQCVLLWHTSAGQLMRTISDTFVKAQLMNSLQRCRPQTWQNRRVQKDNVLYILDQDDLLNDTSMAELAECSYQMIDMPGLLVNFGQSRFSTFQSVVVAREDDLGDHTTITLSMIEDVKSLISWAVDLGCMQLPYSQDSHFPPTDDQTILVDANRFTRTNYREQGRIVYRDINTGFYWYIDNFHFGSSAEIEVFDSRGIHYGTANLAGNIDITNRVDNRRIKL